MQDITEQKGKLRNALRKQLVGLPDRDVKSKMIWERLQDTPEFKSAKSIFGYVGVRSEVETLPYLQLAQANGKQIVLPKVVGQELHFFRADDLSLLTPGSFGIPEPLVSEDATPPHLSSTCRPEVGDLILVPGLGFTRSGKRLGQGGGFFDRFLEHVPKGVFKVGLCFEVQVVPAIPEESHDLPVDFLVTEFGIHRAQSLSKSA